MKALGRCAAALAGLALGFLLMEGVLRLAGWAPMQRHAMASFHDRHPTLGWVGAPGYEARFRSPEFDVVIGSDDEGFRVPGHGVRTDPTAPLVAFLGDSYTWGWGVGAGQTVTDRLQVLLGTDWRVKNYGINGFGTGQQRLLLEEIALPAGARRVVLMFFANDPTDTIDGNADRRPWFRLEGERPVPENVPVAGHISSPSRRFMRRSVALSCARYGFNALSDWVKGAHDTFDPLATGVDRDFVPEGWPVSAALLREMHDLCSAAGVDFRVGYVPTQRDMLDEGSLPPARLRSLLTELCADASIPLLDFTPALHAAWVAHPAKAQSGMPIYFAADMHWSPYGAQVVADTLAETWDW